MNSEICWFYRIKILLFDLLYVLFFIRLICSLPHFLGVYDCVFSFQNNAQYLDLSYKTDLPVDIWDCFRREKPISK